MTGEEELELEGRESSETGFVESRHVDHRLSLRDEGVVILPENRAFRGDGEQTRDFVYVDDVVDATIATRATDHVGEAFNIGTGEATSIRELAETIQELTDTRSDIVHVEGREGDIEHSVADIEKAREELGFEPEVSWEAGVERTVEWHLEMLR